MNELKRSFIIFCGMLFGFSMTILLSATFLTAYFISDDYTVTVTINTFGEANIELITIIPLLVFLSFCLVLSYKSMSDRVDEEVVRRKLLRKQESESSSVLPLYCPVLSLQEQQK